MKYSIFYGPIFCTNRYTPQVEQMVHLKNGMDFQV